MKVNTHNYTRSVIELINDYSSRSNNEIKIDEARKHFKAAMIALEESLQGETNAVVDDESKLEDALLENNKKVKVPGKSLANDIIPVMPMSYPDPSVLGLEVNITPNENLGDSDIFNF